MPLLTGSLSSDPRRLTSGYDRESRRMGRKGFDRAAELLAVKGAEERINRGNIRSVEEETAATATETAIKRADQAERFASAARDKQIKRLEQGARINELTGKPATATAESGQATGTTGQPAVNPDRANPANDAIFDNARRANTDLAGRDLLRGKYDELMAKNDAESAKLTAEKGKTALTESIVAGGTDALKAATDRLQAKYGAVNGPPAPVRPSATGGLEGTIKEIGDSRIGIADELKKSADRAPIAKVGPPTPAPFVGPVANVAPVETGEFRSGIPQAERNKARTDAAAALRAARTPAIAKTVTTPNVGPEGFQSLESPFTSAADTFRAEEAKGYKAPLRSAILAAGAGVADFGKGLYKSFQEPKPEGVEENAKKSSVGSVVEPQASRTPIAEELKAAPSRAAASPQIASAAQPTTIPDAAPFTSQKGTSSLTPNIPRGSIAEELKAAGDGRAFVDAAKQTAAINTAPLSQIPPAEKLVPIPVSIPNVEPQKVLTNTGNASTAAFRTNLAEWMVAPTQISSPEPIKKAYSAAVESLGKAAKTGFGAVALTAENVVGATSIPFAEIQSEIGGAARSLKGAARDLLSSASTKAGSARDAIIKAGKPQADFGKENDASDNSRAVADWVVQKKDQSGKPFVIADKGEGKMHFFNEKGKLIESIPALFGRIPGDSGKKHQTSAGRYPASVYDSEDYGPAVEFEKVQNESGGYNRSLIHRVPLHSLTASPKQRYSALASGTAADNRQTSGCINLDPKAAKRLVPHFAKGGTVYVMPDSEEGKSSFEGYKNLQLKR